MHGIRHFDLRAIVLAVAGALAAAPAAAMSLGSPEVMSYLGQPLRMRVPVTLEEASEASSQCVRLINAPAGDLPGLTFGRVELERGPGATYLRVSSSLPIGEPILRVAVEVGCIRRVRREFTLFLDPPATPGTALAQDAARSLPPPIEFGLPEVIGHRGQPLLVNVPLGGEMARTLTESCVRPGRGSDSGSSTAPRVLQDIRVALIDRGGERSLRIHTPDPIDDARVRVVVEVGCETPVRREFALQVDAPRLASVAGDEAAAAPVARVPRRASRPASRAKLPPVLPPVSPVSVVPPPAKVEPAPVPQAEAPPIEPARLPPREVARPSDRLVLAPPEEAPSADATPRAGEATRTDGPSERELEVLRRVEALTAEVKKLRTELDDSNLRNRQLSESAEATGYAWGSAVAAVLLLGAGFLIGWRGRAWSREAQQPDNDRAGPMTRILGQKTEHHRAPAARAAAAAAAGGAVSAEARRRAGEDTQGESTAIMVTEFGDTTEVIGELYSPYIGRDPSMQPQGQAQPATSKRPDAKQAEPPPAPTPNSEATTIAGQQTKTEIALDLDLGQERPSMLSPQTKTEIAVDIDPFDRNSQVGRDLQREYERLDLVGRKPEPASEAAPESKTPGETQLDLPTIAGSSTVPLTTRLELDLDLSTVRLNPANKPGKSR